MDEQAETLHERPHRDCAAPDRRRVDARGRLEQAQHRLCQARGLLLDERRRRPWRPVGRRARAEDAQACCRTPLREPLRGPLETLILGEAQRELLGRALGVELLLVFGVGIDEQPGLQLTQRRDEHEELRKRLEIDLLSAFDPRKVRQHDVDDRNLDELELLAQHEGEQQVERPRERVEVEVELEDASFTPALWQRRRMRGTSQASARSIACNSRASQRSCAARWSR